MASFLTKLGQGAMSLLESVGPETAKAGVSAVGGPLAGTLASVLVKSVIAAEKAHVAAQAGGINPGKLPGDPPSLTVDPRKQLVLDQFKAFMPLIEAGAAALGRPIADVSLFESLLPRAIDNTVTTLNLYAELAGAIGGPKA